MTLLTDRFPTAAEFLAALDGFWGANGSRAMDLPGRWWGACPACRSKGSTDEAERYPLAVIEKGDGWMPTPACKCSEAAILAALDGSAPVGGRVRVTPLDRVRARAVRWLWARLVPLGKVTVVAGAPGLGKSLLLVWLAALVSRGEAPGNLAGEPAAVLLASAEDDPEDTIKPRALAAGADLSRVSLIDLRETGPDGLPVPGLIQLPRDAPDIETAVRESDARLVVLDPVVAFLAADHSAYREQEVRAALAPLKHLAEETGCAVVVVMHLNKSEGSEPLRRIANSGAFTALARSVLLLGEDPEDEDQRVLAHAKSNSAKGTGLVLRVVERAVRGDAGETIPTGAVELIGESRVGAEDLLGSSEDRGALGDAVGWLRDLLADGPKPSQEVKAAADAEGHSWRTVKRAKAPAGVESDKLGGPGEPWVWRLQDGGDEVREPAPPRDGPLGPLSSTEAARVGTLTEGGQDDGVRGPRVPRVPTPRARARASDGANSGPPEQRMLTEDELGERLKSEFGAVEVEPDDQADELLPNPAPEPPPRTWPRPGPCDCPRPARSPRADAPDQCRTCKRPMPDGDEAAA